MKNNCYDNKFEFIHEPVKFNKFTDKKLLQYCLGATLYMPGTKDIADKLLNQKMSGLTSLVMCFEDAIQESELQLAETNVLNLLLVLSDALANGTIIRDNIPLIFLRVRNVKQFIRFSKKLTLQMADVLSGFVFPKFSSIDAKEYLDHLIFLNQKLNVLLYGMPILEGKTIALKELRINELIKIKDLLKPVKDLILNIRVGATDFSSIFGVRRGINYSIYDISTVKDILTDILNFFSRENDDYVISAPVWEYFLAYKKDDIENLIEKNIHHSLLNGNTIINEAIDGLLREIILDKANGFVGKTIIHPSHLKFVNAMQAVTQEEYDDAIQILETAGGVVKSKNSNKMNEINPHRNWAKKIDLRAKAFGVVKDETSYLKLILDDN